jgi:hypothetical protein
VSLSGHRLSRFCHENQPESFSNMKQRLRVPIGPNPGSSIRLFLSRNQVNGSDSWFTTKGHAHPRARRDHPYSMLRGRSGQQDRRPRRRCEISLIYIYSKCSRVQRTAGIGGSVTRRWYVAALGQNITSESISELTKVSTGMNLNDLVAVSPYRSLPH